MRLPWKASLLTRFRYKERQNDWKASKFETSSYWRYKEIDVTRKVSGRSRNGHQGLTNDVKELYQSKHVHTRRACKIRKACRTCKTRKACRTVDLLIKYSVLWLSCCSQCPHRDLRDRWLAETRKKSESPDNESNLTPQYLYKRLRATESNIPRDVHTD